MDTQFCLGLFACLNDALLDEEHDDAAFDKHQASRASGDIEFRVYLMEVR